MSSSTNLTPKSNCFKLGTFPMAWNFNFSPKKKKKKNPTKPSPLLYSFFSQIKGNTQTLQVILLLSIYHFADLVANISA